MNLTLYSRGPFPAPALRSVAKNSMSIRLGVSRLLVVCCALFSSTTHAQSTKPAAPNQGSAQPAAAATAAPTHFRPSVPRRAAYYYDMVWGVDSLDVKSTESGEVIRFTYRVLDPVKAKVLNDKRYQPSLIDPQVGVKLSVPSLEKVGQLRQSSTPEAGKVYWMAFSNKERFVKKGHRVDIVIGNFRAEGLVVN